MPKSLFSVIKCPLISLGGWFKPQVLLLMALHSPVRPLQQHPACITLCNSVTPFLSLIFLWGEALAPFSKFAYAKCILGTITKKDAYLKITFTQSSKTIKAYASITCSAQPIRKVRCCKTAPFQLQM